MKSPVEVKTFAQHGTNEIVVRITGADGDEAVFRAPDSLGFYDGTRALSAQLAERLTAWLPGDAPTGPVSDGEPPPAT